MSPTNMLREVVLWQVLEDGTVREVIQPQLVDAPPYDLGEATSARPQVRAPYWPEGRYVFEIRRLEGPGSRWIGLEFIPASG